MNREIKFRAWDINKKIFIPENVWAVVQTDFKAFGVMLNDWEDYREGEYFYSEHQSLSQFTSLKDKNGKEVFEGDICKVTYYNHSMPNSEIIQVVNYDLGTFSLKKQNSVSELEDDRTNVPLYYCFAPNKIEVIGNIYENYELLK